MGLLKRLLHKFTIKTAILTVLLLMMVVISSYILTILSKYNVVMKQQEARYEQILIAKEIERIKTNIILAAMDSIIDKDEGEIEPERMRLIHTLFKRFHDVKSALLEACDTPMERETSRKVVLAIEALEPIITQKLVNMIRSRALEAEFIQLDDDIDVAAGSVDEDITKIIKSIEEEVIEAKKEAQEYADTTIIEVSIAALSMLVLGVFVFTSIIRLLINVPLRTTVSDIVEANKQVISASDQIASLAIALSQGATQQVEGIEEINVTMHSALELNNENALRTTNATRLAIKANESAEQGTVKIHDLVMSMQEISSSSMQISKIIKTIDEIAFQTNLLSLNAAVEAARAGEHGLGFAVVADEVKSLAHRSASAAKETERIILESIKQIEKGNKIANETQMTFKEIVEKIKMTSNDIDAINSSSQEQIEQFNALSTALKVIEDIAQQNAATSEEASATAEELNAQSNTMFDIVATVGLMVQMHIDKEESEPEMYQLTHQR